MNTYLHYLKQNLHRFLYVHLLINCLFFTLKYLNLPLDEGLILRTIIGGLAWIPLVSYAQFKGWHDPK